MRGLRLSLSLTGSRFNPLSLFAAGEQGFLFDIQDLSSMYQDSAGTTPAAVDSPVGKVNDKSGRGNHATQTVSASRPTLRNDGSRYYLEFDGTDDYLRIGSARLYNAGAHTLIAGILCAGQQNKVLYAEGRSASATPFYDVIASQNVVSGTGVTGLLRNDAAVYDFATGSFIAAGGFDGTKRVITNEDSGSNVESRVDRGAWASKAYARTTTTLDQASIGCVATGAAGTGAFITGRLYGLMGVGRLLTASEMTKAENLQASNMAKSL